MSKPVVVVKTVFCRDGFSQVLEKVADGQYPCSVLCGDGVGACEHDEAHCELCLKKFHAMNFLPSGPELQVAIELVLKRRAIGEPEQQRLLQLRPDLQTAPPGPGVPESAAPARRALGASAAPVRRIWPWVRGTVAVFGVCPGPSALLCQEAGPAPVRFCVLPDGPAPADGHDLTPPGRVVLLHFWLCLRQLAAWCLQGWRGRPRS